LRVLQRFWKTLQLSPSELMTLVASSYIASALGSALRIVGETNELLHFAVKITLSEIQWTRMVTTIHIVLAFLS
jgi:uncharacterized protein with HEPN domain